MKPTICLCLLFVLQACTTKSWYSGMQMSAESQCRQKPGEEAQRCLAGLKKQSYEDYEKERQGGK